MRKRGARHIGQAARPGYRHVSKELNGALAACASCAASVLKLLGQLDSTIDRTRLPLRLVHACKAADRESRAELNARQHESALCRVIVGVAVSDHFDAGPRIAERAMQKPQPAPVCVGTERIVGDAMHRPVASELMLALQTDHEAELAPVGVCVRAGRADVIVAIAAACRKLDPSALPRRLRAEREFDALPAHAHRFAVGAVSIVVVADRETIDQIAAREERCDAAQVLVALALLADRCAAEQQRLAGDGRFARNGEGRDEQEPERSPRFDRRDEGHGLCRSHGRLMCRVL